MKNVFISAFTEKVQFQPFSPPSLDLFLIYHSSEALFFYATVKLFGCIYRQLAYFLRQIERFIRQVSRR
jgi:hypothetical protein